MDPNTSSGKNERARVEWREFENAVATLYRLMGFHIVPDCLISGRQVDILAEKYIEGIGKTCIVIECKHTISGVIGRAEIDEFTNFCNRARQEGSITKGVMVTNGEYSRFAKEATARSSAVEFLTRLSLENQLLDVADVYRRFVDQYEQTEIFSTYVALGAYIVGSYGTRERVRNAELAIEEKIRSDDTSFVCLLGDFGAGKTTLVNRMKYQAALRVLSNSSCVKPFLVLLKEFHRYMDLESLVKHSIAREFQREVPLSLFWRAADEGQFLFLLDGFDEMTPQVDARKRLDNFVSLSRFFGTRSKTILTCRPSYFVSIDEYNSLISTLNAGEDTLTEYIDNVDVCPPALPGRSVKKQFKKRRQNFETLMERLSSRIERVDLLKPVVRGKTLTLELDVFSEKEVDLYLQNYNQRFLDECGCDWKAVKDFLMEVYDLRDLMTRPILLSMIAETVVHGAIDVANKKLVMSPAILYRAYTDMKLNIDWRKGPTRRLLSADERRMFAKATAIGMFRRRKLELSYEELKEVVQTAPSEISTLRSVFERASAEEIATDVQTCTFLSRQDDGLFRFIHKSFMEYFVALHLQEQTLQDTVDPLHLLHLPKEVLYFLAAVALFDPRFKIRLLTWHRKCPVARESRQVFQRNIAAILLCSACEHDAIKLLDVTVDAIDLMHLLNFA
ncbi:MAG: restriction endonuclease [Phycisphaerae bacterium]|nr:restriction endonuclease [Phycisphaerae bacterium]